MQLCFCTTKSELPSWLVKLTARLAALYTALQMPVEVLISLGLSEASYCDTKGCSRVEC